jgi:hypothetical protein
MQVRVLLWAFKMAREKKENPTIDLCHHRKEITGELCPELPSWRVKNDKLSFKVCDAHLAWGIRFSGTPALVDKHVPRNRRTKQFKIIKPLLEGEIDIDLSDLDK